MNLNELFELQRKLDEHIVKEKGLEGQDLLPKKILALQVELGNLQTNGEGLSFGRMTKSREPKHTKVNYHQAESFTEGYMKQTHS